jgi:hypothetical protein
MEKLQINKYKKIMMLVHDTMHAEIVSYTSIMRRILLYGTIVTSLNNS